MSLNSLDMLDGKHMHVLDCAGTRGCNPRVLCLMTTYLWEGALQFMEIAQETHNKDADHCCAVQ